MRSATRWTVLASLLCGCAPEPYEAAGGGALSEPPAGKNYLATPEGSGSRVAIFGAWADDVIGLLRDMTVSPGWMPGDFMTIPTAHGTLIVKEAFTCVERPRGRSQCEFLASTVQEENGTIRFGGRAANSLMEQLTTMSARVGMRSPYTSLSDSIGGPGNRTRESLVCRPAGTGSAECSFESWLRQEDRANVQLQAGDIHRAAGRYAKDVQHTIGGALAEQLDALVREGQQTDLSSSGQTVPSATVTVDGQDVRVWGDFACTTSINEGGEPATTCTFTTVSQFSGADLYIERRAAAVLNRLLRAGSSEAMAQAPLTNTQNWVRRGAVACGERASTGSSHYDGASILCRLSQTDAAAQN